MRRGRDSQSHQEERPRDKRENVSSEPNAGSQSMDEMEGEDIGGDIDPQKWERFRGEHGVKRLTQGGEE
eukprot:3730160-Karenia_brevis.AAC.1